MKHNSTYIRNMLRMVFDQKYTILAQLAVYLKGLSLLHLAN